MNRKNERSKAIYMLIVIMLAGPVALAAEPGNMIWWDVKSGNADTTASLEMSKSLTLRCGKFPRAELDENNISKLHTSNNTRIWIRDPDGIISEANLSPEKETVVLDFPTELNPAKSNGHYLVGIHVNAGVMDIDSDGTGETVHYYAKYLIYHRTDGGIQGDKPDVFFKDPDKIALEIGPLNTHGVGEIPSMEAGYQEALKEHKIKVLYKGQPLANVEVAVLTKGGWEKRKKTDSDGIVSITPVENQRKETKSLYVVTHKDLLAGQYYCSSLMMYVLKPPPAWMSKAEGFVFWAVGCTDLFVVYVGWRIHRRKKRDRKTMLKFERHKIRKD
ncbi:MAG: hypothetical protein SRB2_03991 [Desulfobacteraceae bacterium Eth-SRB2]|nr:MAG: hypothetical protein SRB2_03991 [Desulfobacteraceae bacterium Eth-SRB2]